MLDREREKKKGNMDLNISSQNNSAKISCNVQLITSKISLKWYISTVLFARKIYQGEALHKGIHSVVTGTQLLLAADMQHEVVRALS